jgi:hypothetical protein
MSKKRWSLVVFASAVAFALILTMGCEQKKRTLGSVNRVIVLADSTVWDAVGEDVQSALEKEVYTPQPEKILITVRQQPGKIGELKRYPHILFVGTLESEGVTREIVDQLLTSESRQRVQEDAAYLFKKPDAWSRGQLLVAVIAKDLQTLETRLQENDDALFNVINDHANQIIWDGLYTQYEQKEIEQSLLEEHGWRLRVQHDYFAAIDSSEARFVWLRRLRPQRDLFVYWEPCNDPSKLSKEWIISTRDSLTQIYYDGDYIYQGDKVGIQRKEVEFNGQYAIRLDGVWQNDNYTAGGPFRSYGFYSETDNRLYLIDMLVFRPGKRKWSFMRQLDGIAHTFRTQEQLETQ